MSNDVSERTTGTNTIAARVQEAPPRSLPAVLEAVSPVSAVWAPPTGDPLVALGAEAVITETGSNRFQRIKDDGQTLLGRVQSTGQPRPARPRLFGGFSFFDLDDLAAPWTQFSANRFHLPAIQITLTEDRTSVTGFGERATNEEISDVVETIENAPAVESKGSVADTAPSDLGSGTEKSRIDEGGLRPNRDAWVDRVRSIHATIEESDLQKAVLAAAFDQPLDGPISLASILHRLEARYPDCYRFGFTGRTDPSQTEALATFFGASPETLVAQRGRKFETEALAGTVERGDSPTDDHAMRERLLADATLENEHELVVDRIATQLDRFGAEVRVGDRGIRTLANVHHLQTPISGGVPSGTHVLDLVELLHPTPAVGGLPTETARRTIADVESTVRGWYGAPIGWFDEEGDGTFAVGIRSALASKRRATLFAGNGIVAGSDPQTEYEELAAKFEPIREVLE